eukprot:m.45637 g.45637  ORF g.45637 m.45637 type:complete len:669 (-) comp6255_c0_seq1:63-2069(-)
MASWEAYVTLAIVTVMLVLMAREVAPPDMIMMGSLILFIPMEIITVEEAIQGFCNTGMLTVAVLFMVAAGVERTGAIEPVRRLMLKLAAAPEGRHVRLPWLVLIVMVPVSLLSAFLNNTPVVAMMIPLLDSFGRSLGISPSKLLIPLSYASILGGTCTLIGTSTNLVVIGLAEDNDPDFSMGIFDIAKTGLPVLLAGVLYVTLWASRGLPSRLSVTDALDRPREYITVMIVSDDPKNNALVGKTIADAGLRAVPGLFLVQIERSSGDIFSAPGPSTILAAGDKLFFAGVVDSVLSLSQIRGLRIAEEEEESVDLYRLKGQDILVEAVVAPHSGLCHHTVRDLSFRRRYNAAIIAVHRHGTRIDKRIGDIVLEGGDTLLLVSSRDFVQLYRNSEHFALVSPVSNHLTLRRDKASFAAFVTLAMVGVSLGGYSLLTAALFATALLILFKCIKAKEARGAINLEVLIVIAAAFGISAAMVNSGAAKLVADGLVAAADPTGILGLYICIYMATVVFTAAVTNNAAVTIMFPVALEAAKKTDEDFLPFIFLLMMGASASFLTPTGYQTNLMVYGPGGYTFMDFVRFGGPLQVIVGVVTIGVVMTLDLWWLWAGIGAAAIFVVFFLLPKTQLGPPRNSRRPSISRSANAAPAPEERYFFQPDMGLEIIHDPIEL